MNLEQINTSTTAGKAEVMLLAAAVMLPFWLIEKAIEVQNDFSDWLYWKWRNANWLEWMTVTLTTWVGKIEESEPKERKVDE